MEPQWSSSTVWTSLASLSTHFLHASSGGPGGGVDAEDRCFFNPEKYKIVLFDQRGSGKSIPSACLEDNTTWDLVKDTEKIRELLKIDKWHVFGGSWVGPSLVLNMCWKPGT